MLSFKSKRFWLILAALTALLALGCLGLYRDLFNVQTEGGWVFRIFVPFETRAVQIYCSWPTGPAIDGEQLRTAQRSSTKESWQLGGFQFTRGSESPDPVLIRHIVSRRGSLSAADRGLWTRPHRYVLAEIPFWIFLICLVVVFAWLGRWGFSTRKVAPGVCVNCGYDMRCTPQRCPECGKEGEKGTSKRSMTGADRRADEVGAEEKKRGHPEYR
jgi:hypothetical protein